jgi:hypothetical protein
MLNTTELGLHVLQHTNACSLSRTLLINVTTYSGYNCEEGMTTLKSRNYSLLVTGKKYYIYV